MKKTYVVTITLTYDSITNENELKKAVYDEAVSWVSLGSFDDDLHRSGGNGELSAKKVTIKQK